VDYVIRQDRSVLDFLTADYTFVNEQLARHYGIPGVYGSHFRRVTISDPNRRGLLGQGGVLMVTAYPNRTSPVLRGKWLLDNFLGSPPPPPPPDVDTSLQDTGEGGRAATGSRASGGTPPQSRLRGLSCADGSAWLRARELRRDRRMENDGFRASPVDATGALPDGTVLNGPAGLQKFLLAQREQFVTDADGKVADVRPGQEGRLPLRADGAPDPTGGGRPTITGGPRSCLVLSRAHRSR
jgi:hypothetical protein